ncbi:MAG: glycosyltransferase family 39 protein, partial [Proteobacteria bacterium]|nr:glycosyltransferase family 39 protein [Pseudomonadota bacterium]
MNGGSRILWAAALLLVLHASLVAWGIARNSVTIDEANHLPAGMSYVRFGTYELYHQNPPLVKLLATGPALLAGASEDYGRFWRHARMTGGPINYVGMGQDFMRANESPPGHYHRIYRAARVVGLLFSILGGVALFTWARELFGDRAGLVSLALWCFSPNIIANAAILTTDLPAAVMILVSTYAFWRWLHGPRPGWLGACLVGVLLGLAQLTKFSALALFGLWPLLAIPVLAGWGETGQRKAPGPLLARGAAIVTLSLLTINLGYGFEGSGRHLGEFDFLSTTLTVPRLRPADPQPLHFHRAVYSARVNRFRGTVLEDLPVPLPEHYLLGLDEQS